MRKILTIAVAGAALTVAPALAAKPADKPEHPPHPAKCKINSVGYNAKGKLVALGANWAQSKGADTPTDKSDDRYSGDLTVDVSKANHKAPKGEQTLTLTDAKVSFYDAANDGTDDVPVAGDTVRLHGKLTKYKKKCPGDSTVITVKRVDFKQAAPTT
jgi:hypothetical protein